MLIFSFTLFVISFSDLQTTMSGLSPSSMSLRIPNCAGLLLNSPSALGCSTYVTFIEHTFERPSSCLSSRIASTK